MSESAIVTHGDFDGIISAALVSLWSGIRFTTFTGPESVRRIEVGRADIICDLPHPMRTCRAWFDHHLGNIEEAQKLNLSIGEGAAWEAPSAARVVYEHLKEKTSYPPFIEDTVIAGDRVDSMDYATLSDWLADSPENIINRTIFLPGEDLRAARPFLLHLMSEMKTRPLDVLAGDAEVFRRHKRYAEDAARFTDLVAKIGQLIADGEILLLNFSEMKTAPRISKNHAYSVHPEVRAVLSVNAVYQGDRRTNDLRISFSLNPFIVNEKAPDLATLFEEIGIGGGHPSAAGGRITADSKDARLKLFREVLADIESGWRKSRSAAPARHA